MRSWASLGLTRERPNGSPVAPGPGSQRAQVSVGSAMQRFYLIRWKSGRSLVAFSAEVSKAALLRIGQRAEVEKAELLGHAAARLVVDAGPEREAFQAQLFLPPPENAPGGLGRVADSGAVGADPVMKLGAPIVIAIQTDDPEDESALAGDEVELLAGHPGAFRFGRVVLVAFQGDLASPGHPGEQLRPRGQGGLVETECVSCRHRFEPKPAGFQCCARWLFVHAHGAQTQ